MILKFVDKEYVRTDGAAGNILLDINDGTDYFVQLNTFTPQPASQTQKFAESPLADYKKLSPTQTKLETIIVPLEIKVIGDDEADLHDKVEALMLEMRRDEVFLMHRFEDGVLNQDERYYECNPAAQIDDSRAWELELQTHDMAIISCNLDAKQPYGRWETLDSGDFTIEAKTPTKITIAPGIVKGDDLASCDIYLQATGTPPTNYILGQRYLYSPDWAPVVEPISGTPVTLATRRTSNYRSVSTLLDTELLVDGGLEVTSGSGNNSVWTHWTPERLGPFFIVCNTAVHHSGSASVKCGVLIDPEPATTPRTVSGTMGRMHPVSQVIDPSKDHLITVWLARSGIESAYMRSLIGLHCHAANDDFLGTIILTHCLPTLAWESRTFFVPSTRLFANTAKIHPYWMASTMSHAYRRSAYMLMDDMSMKELDRAVIEATFPINSHRGIVLPTAGIAFSAGATTYHGVTFRAFLRTTGGDIMSPSTLPQRVEPDQSQTQTFTEIALLDERVDSIQIPSHAISDNVDESTIVQVIQLETDPQLTDDFWYDEIALLPVDRAFVEVSNYVSQYLILDSHSKQILTSVDGTLGKAQIYDPLHTKGTPHFVIDPKGCNFTLLAVNSVDNDDQLNPVVGVTMKYRPVYRW